MRLALIQMNSRTAARDENVERPCAFGDKAARRHPDIAIQASGIEEQVVSAEIEREAVIRARRRFLPARDR